jgi:lipopolysaccharide transport protein LptA
MTRRAAASGAISLLWLLVSAGAGAQAASPSSPEAVSPKTDVSIGVAPFERRGDVGSDVPDVAMMLARRLSTLGVERVVSPRELGVEPTAEAQPAEIAGWAEKSAVDTVVVGHTTALGGKLSIDARLHAGVGGEAVGRRFFVEASRARDLPVAVQGLAEQVLTQIAEAELPTRVAAAPPTTALEDAPEPRVGEASERSGRKGSGKGGFQKDAAISIRSDVLDVYDRGGQKRFVFRGNVRANQGDLKIRSERLEAFYPPGGSQPHKIVATGNVTMKQAGRAAVCDTATFFRNEDRMVCEGDIAEVEQGCDVVRGREIIFHTESEQLKVNGAADVRINPEGSCGAKGVEG